MTTLDALRVDIRKTLLSSPPALDHVLPGLLAATVGTMVAPGGVGKTMLLTQIGCAIAAGQPVLGGALNGTDPSPAKVVLFLGEETLPVMHHRLHAVSQQIVATMTSPSRENLQRFLDLLSENLAVLPLGGHGVSAFIDEGSKAYTELRQLCVGARLVVFDPLRRFHDGDENDSAVMTAVVGRFERLARETGAAVVVAHHANRNSVSNGTGEQSVASRGSTALTDGVRWQANLSPVSESLAKDFGIDSTTARQYVRFDGSKTNHCRPMSPVLLRKAPESGVMSVWQPDIHAKRQARASGRAGGQK